MSDLFPAVEQTIPGRVRELFRHRFLRPLQKSYVSYIKRDEQKTLVVFLGLRRSGNHAVIHWLMSQMKGQVAFCNDIGPEKLPENSKFKEFRITGFRSKFMIVSYEDHEVPRVFSNYLPTWGPSSQNYNVLLLRNPFNLFASWFSWELPLGQEFRTNVDYQSKMIDLWKSHAKQFLNWSKGGINNRCVPILFDRWLVDREYRENLSFIMGLDPSRATQRRESKYGGGTSFRGGSQYDRLNRWREFEGNPDFQEVLHDAELNEIWMQVEASIL